MFRIPRAEFRFLGILNFFEIVSEIMTQNFNTIFGNCVKIYYILFKGHHKKSNSNDFKKRLLMIMYYKNSAGMFRISRAEFRF